MDLKTQPLRFTLGKQSSLAPEREREERVGEEDDPEGIDPRVKLMYLANEADLDGIKELLDSGLDVNFRDIDDRTALHVAACQGLTNVVSLLLDRGADIDPKDRWGSTPLADAIYYKNHDVIKLLEKRGAKPLMAPMHVRHAREVPEYEIDPKELDFTNSDEITKGTYRTASWRGIQVAVKMLAEEVLVDEDKVKAFRDELALLQKIRHPNVVQFLGAVTQSSPMMIVTEYLPKGDLRAFLKQRGALKPITAVKFALDIARGMSYLHENKPEAIIHRDLEPSNILRDDSGHLKVADFGVSKLLTVKEDRPLICQDTSCRYIAPEVFKNEEYDTKVDVFSFALILQEMIENCLPFAAQQDNEVPKAYVAKEGKNQRLEGGRQKMEERAKCLALLGFGALVGSVSTILLLKFRPRTVNGCDEKGGIGPVSKTRTNCCAVSGNGNNKMAGVDLLSDEIVSEQLTRNIQFFGLEPQQKVTASYVVVIGLGGVGSHAASMLLRSGVGRLLLVDFDQVSVSSLNRHAVATRADVGIPKAQCLKEHFLSIFPECHIDAKVLLYNESSEEEILAGHPDFVLDCIDNIDTKVALLAACVRRGLNVLSATGAGARADPTRIRVADLRQSTNDPLSRSVRHRLRRDYGIEGGVTVVFSLEKPKAKLLPFKGPSGEEENPSDYQILPGFRVRIIPVLGTIPAIFGQVMASFVLTQLAGLQVQTEPIVNLDIDHYRMLHQRLIEHEESLYGTALHVQVDVEEVMYIAKELWHGRSAREPFAKDVGRGMWRSVNELMLVRWDREKPASVSNLILLKFKEADEHESITLEDIKEREAEFFDRVTSVLKRAELEFGL